MIKYNTNYTIATSNCLESFLGIKKITRNSYIHLKFTNSSELKCSEDHKIMTDSGFKSAKDLKKTDYIETIDNKGCFIKSKRRIRKKIELYDIIDSGINNTYYTNGILSHNCEFFGSSGTLISGPKLQVLSFKDPLEIRKESLKIYELPSKDKSYVVIVDTSEGMGKDYSAISVIDVTELPYKQVAVYRRNDLIPMIFADEVFHICKLYNEAFCMVENNSVGAIVANILFYEYEYDNMLQSGNKNGETIVNTKSVGLRQSPKTKAIGCATLKTLIESDSLILYDFDTITELSSFIKKGSSYEAEKNKTDDIVMTLVMFAWLTTQPYFEDYTNTDIKGAIRANYAKMDEYNSLIFGFFNNGIPEEIIDLTMIK
ncbi:MAG: hypothetical protein PHC28_08990 [Flavobacterium sp.]|uniref:phage terminase large subunit family protein n=1 Tax=Flavobacterium sp. TaxID=239 RepID=UPI00262C67BD|nr:hypothetical protein [Flavobacterium sp.]MDD5150604.1 hypothetical protein [Flavobacterium sp.]